MPTLLQINSNLNSGGAGRIVEQIGKGALASGWESYAAFGRLNNPSELKAIRIGNFSSVLIHGFKTLILDQHGLGSSIATYLLIEKIKSIKPDVIHLHGLHGYYINVDILFSYLARTEIPVVWTMHDCWAITGHCTFFSDINCSKWEKECFECPKKRNYPSSLIVDRSKRNFQMKKLLFSSVKNLTVVSVSEWLNQIMQRSFLKNADFRVILNGVDIGCFRPESQSINNLRNKLGIGNKHMLLGVATSWGERKGWKDYMKLSEILPDTCVIVMVGLSNRQIKMLPPEIIGIQRTESLQELRDYYTTADVILNLSYMESFGLTTVEGFACGTPSIVYNSTASPELMNNETGLIVEPGNISQLADAVNQIIEKGKEYYKVNCRKRAETKFNKEDKIKEYQRLYSELINRNIHK